MSERIPEYAVRNRASWTKANAEYTDRQGREAWARDAVEWGVYGIPERDVRALPDVAGKEVVELGCGTAYFGAWLKRLGAARVVGVDVTPAQLDTARELDAHFGLGLEFVEANAEDVPLPDGSFDVAVSEYGASIWCDPFRWIPEAARLLRPGGELVFLRNSTLAVLCGTAEGGWSTTLQRPQRGLHRLDWPDEGTTEFQMGHADWFRVLRNSGFDVVDLIELFAPEGAQNHEYYFSDAEWAKQWPWEEIWRARKRA